jgi:hypothetical protein
MTLLVMFCSRVFCLINILRHSRWGFGCVVLIPSVFFCGKEEGSFGAPSSSWMARCDSVCIILLNIFDISILAWLDHHLRWHAAMLSFNVIRYGPSVLRSSSKSPRTHTRTRRIISMIISDFEIIFPSKP